MFWHLGAEPETHHRWLLEGRLSVHHNLVAFHEMHMKDVPYINHLPVKFQEDFLFSFLNIVYLYFPDDFFCQVVV